MCSTAICDELAEDWLLSPDLRRSFDYREGCACRHCGASVRVMNFALSLLEVINLKFFEGYQFVCDIDWLSLAHLRLAEINQCGVLHKYLCKLPHLSYSEYGSVDPAVRSEDLMELSYQDSCFDIVLTSDVLEHVPCYRRALVEIFRIIKQGGVLILTVPWISGRETVARARGENAGELELLAKASFHGEYHMKMNDYLVVCEFGYDFVQDLQALFEVEIYCYDGFGKLVSSVFVCRKTRSECEEPWGEVCAR